MSGIIKSQNLADHAHVRPFGIEALAPLPSPLEVERDRLQQRIGALEGELRQRDSALASLRTETARAFEQGRAEGHAAGLTEAQDRQADRLALLETALQQAQMRLRESLPSLERLAVMLSRETLDIVLGDPEYRAEAVSKIVEAQIAKIEKSALLAVELSRDDFPDKKSLTNLAKRIDVPAVRLSAKDERVPGDCVMTLRLGRMNVGIDQQWGMLRDVLGEMAEPEGAA